LEWKYHQKKSGTFPILGQEPGRCTVVVDNKCLQQVKSFKYLGYEISYNNKKRYSTKASNVFSSTGNSNNTLKANSLQKFSGIEVRGSFQKFCTLYVVSLKMNLFYKIHLQAFNVISIMLYHSGSAFGKVLYSCLDAFVVDASDYSGHLIRHLLNTSEAFPTEWFLQFWEQFKVCWAQLTRL
jgi:hypothetical protein